MVRFRLTVSLFQVKTSVFDQKKAVGAFFRGYNSQENRTLSREIFFPSNRFSDTVELLFSLFSIYRPGKMFIFGGFLNTFLTHFCSLPQDTSKYLKLYPGLRFSSPFSTQLFFVSAKHVYKNVTPTFRYRSHLQHTTSATRSGGRGGANSIVGYCPPPLNTMGAAWRRARGGNKRTSVSVHDDGGGGDGDGDGDSGDGCNGKKGQRARVSATARKTTREPTSHIRWNTTFHARQAYKVAVEAAQQSATDVAQQSAGATVGAADDVPDDVDDEGTTDMRLQWHFFSNLLLSLMRDGTVVSSLPESMDEKYVRHLMRGRFKIEQFECARGKNGRIMRSQVWTYIPEAAGDEANDAALESA